MRQGLQRGCPLVAHVENGRVHSIRDNPLRGPYMRGCQRVYMAHRLLDAPDRLAEGELAGSANMRISTIGTRPGHASRTHSILVEIQQTGGTS